MWTKDSIFYEDISDITKADFIDWEKLKNKTIFVTGGTGLIGATLIKGLDFANKEKNLEIKIIALVRNIKKAEQIFSDVSKDTLEFAEGSVEALPEIKEDIDYIIHGASPTRSRTFVDNPVETIHTAVIGTDNILKLAKEKNVSGMVYMSSMEMYGYPEKGHKVTEEESGALSPLDVRNSYPISKQLCENLCVSYAKEYGINANIIRLTQTFGSNAKDDDTRIFSYFAKCVENGEDIVLKTAGESERSYLFGIDAATSILTVLLKGEPGMAYNAADESTYASIAEMAKAVAKDGGINVRFDIQDVKDNGFPDTVYMDLDTSKIRELGWKPLRTINIGRE